MTFGFEPFQFSTDNYQVPKAQVIAEIGDLEPGEVGFCSLDDVWADHENKLWINGYAQLVPHEYLELHIESVESEIARIIRVNQGLVLDASHYQRYNYESPELRLARYSLREVLRSDEDVSPTPVIYLVNNTEELDIIKPALAANNISLDDTEIGHLIDLDEDAFGEDEDDDEGKGDIDWATPPKGNDGGSSGTLE